MRLIASITAVLFVLGSFLAREARAQSEPAELRTSESPEEHQQLETAKELFRAANALMNNGDFPRAYELFMQSRERYPSWQNTINAALCLERMGRIDEALDLFEAALIEFQATLTPETLEGLGPKLSELRATVGLLQVTSNVDGAVTVDGRPRGSLPLTTPLRVMPGERSVRVIKDGYQTFEAVVNVEANKSVALDAKLEALVASGRLRIEPDIAQAAEVRVDGSLVGNTPWEGTVAPGQHVYEVVAGDIGTGPRSVQVLELRTVTVTPTLQPLGGTLRLQITPSSAKLRIDSVELPTTWTGRLTLGEHTLTATEEGYFPETRTVAAAPGEDAGVTVELRADPNHPRWVQPEEARIWVEGAGGFALASSLGSEAESCATLPCDGSGWATGFLAVARGGYEFPVGISIEVSGGYLAVTKKLKRGATLSVSGESVRYRLQDDLHLGGPIVSGGAGYRLPIAEPLSLQFRAHAAVYFASATDRIDGTMSSDAGTTRLTVDGSGGEASAPAVLVLPELQALVELGAWRLGIGLSALIFPLAGPEFPHGELHPDASCPGASADGGVPVECISGTDVLADEKAFGPFAILSVGASVGWAF